MVAKEFTKLSPHMFITIRPCFWRLFQKSISTKLQIIQTEITYKSYKKYRAWWLRFGDVQLKMVIMVEWSENDLQFENKRGGEIWVYEITECLLKFG